MPPLAASVAARSWSRQAWSVLRAYLPVLLGLGAVLALAVALWWYAPTLLPWQGTALGTALAILTLLVVLRLCGISLFGPILFYDLIRSGRGGRHVLIRCGYLIALLFMLSVLYLEWFGGLGTSTQPMGPTPRGLPASAPEAEEGPP